MKHGTTIGFMAVFAGVLFATVTSVSAFMRLQERERMLSILRF